MKALKLALCFALIPPTAVPGAANAAPRKPAPMRAADIVGSYELVERVLAGGKVLKKPDIAALYTMAGGRANLNLFVRNADGTLASESSIIRYTLSATTYCEWIEYTTRNNLDAPGPTNVAPPVSQHCTRLKFTRAGIVFAPPGEGVTTTYDRNGFTAVIAGQFTDHWRRIG